MLFQILHFESIIFQAFDLIKNKFHGLIFAPVVMRQQVCRRIGRSDQAQHFNHSERKYMSFRSFHRRLAGFVLVLGAIVSQPALAIVGSELGP